MNKNLIKHVNKLGFRFPNAQISKDLEYSKGTLSEVLKGNRKASENFLKKFSNFYNIAYKDLIDLEKTDVRNELTKKEYKGQTSVRVVSSKAQASWSDSYYSEEYLKDMPEVLIESDESYKGNYLAFEVDGESMEPEYYKEDIVICREVQRHLWNYKLHYKDWDFVIAHGTQGIMLKEITSHNVETGEIVCHSLHPNHDDFSLNLREVAFLYNVVEVRQKGRSKRKNR